LYLSSGDLIYHITVVIIAASAIMMSHIIRLR
jgi:hypothetical protein